LKYFSRYGEIVRYSHGDGNWINIQYQTKLQAQKALSKNGTLVLEGVMVGVTSCSERKQPNGITSPEQPRYLSNNLDSIQPILQHQKYRPASNSYAVESTMPTNVPQAYNSWWSKISEFVFGM